MEHFIYFIQAGSGPIKIGITKNIMDRYRGLQSANPEQLRLLRAIHGTVKDEADLLQRFREDNIRGEWFHPSGSLLSHINDLPSELSNNFNEVLDGQCDCGNDVSKMQFHEGKFTGCCHRCLMIKDGRMEKLIEKSKHRPKKDTPETCKICGEKELYLRKGRCTTCSVYFKRTGKDRSNHLQKLQKDRKRPRTCSVCGRFEKWLTKNLCSRCDYYQRRYGTPMPPHRIVPANC